MKPLLALYFLLSLTWISCDIPRDPSHSLSKARDQGLRVGVSVNPPYVVENGEHYSGTEIALIQEFARVNGLSIRYEQGSESTLVTRLENREMDLVVGGIEKSSLWKQKVAFSTPYDGRHVILCPKGENKLLYHLEEIILTRKS
jgi:membrane-bound lytic murein transglycosylase MltF